jgi:hypothetical protein
LLRRRVPASIILGLTILALVLIPNPVFAETYTLVSVPSRSQESNTPGVTLTLTVSGAIVGQPYSFLWTVRDPTGAAKNATTSIPSATSTFTQSVNYPASFASAAAIIYVGRYTVSISQTLPSPKLGVASGLFTVGLTDKTNYQRTYPVSIKATSYTNLETVTVDIIHAGSHAPGFPYPTTADSTGNIAYTWQTPASVPTGNYTITLTGASTSKIIPDRQTIILFPTNVTVSQITAQLASLQKTQTEQLSFTATYLSGLAVQSGIASVDLNEPGGTVLTIPANYNSNTGKFLAVYRIPLNSDTGNWTAMVDTNSLNDGYGNGGPASGTVTSFIVQSAVLNVTVTVQGGNHASGDILAIYALVTNPDGTSFNQGTVTAFITPTGKPIASQISLQYDLTNAKWVGSYTIAGNDPSGVWKVQVSASDPYGNTGQGSTSPVITIGQASIWSSFPTLWFLSLLGAIGGGLILGLLVFRKRRVHTQLKVDLQAVGAEANVVKNQEFFRSVKEQLEKQRKNKEQS